MLPTHRCDWFNKGLAIFSWASPRCLVPPAQVCPVSCELLALPYRPHAPTRGPLNLPAQGNPLSYLAPELAAPHSSFWIPCPSLLLLWPFYGALAGLFQELWAEKRWVSSPSLCITPHLFLTWLLAWACIPLARLDFLDPAQTKPVPLGLYPPSHICPARHPSALHPFVCWLLMCALTGLSLLLAAAPGVHCAYTAPVLLHPQLLLSVLFRPLRYAEPWWLPAHVHTCCCYCCCKAFECHCHSDHIGIRHSLFLNITILSHSPLP